ncbi:DHX38, partial [Symbiodinium necroappetens]
METAAGIWEQVARQVPLDVLVLILAAATFAAGIITYCYEAHSALDCVPSSPKDIEDASPVSVPEKATDIEQDRRHKAREDLPEPEPEKCDEDSRRNGLEVCLERLPGEAWGFAWHSKAFCEQRLIVVGIDPDSPAGRWQLQREHQGLPTVQRGDELVCANDVTQHSSMQISLVVANRLRLKFLRAEGVADLARGVMPKLEAKDACKEEVLKETPALPPLQPDTFAESDTDDLAETGSQNLLNYDGVPRNFWSYQRLPRSLPAETVDAAPVDSQSEQRAPEAAQQPLCEKTTVRSVPLRSRSDPPAAPRRRGGSTSPASRASRDP